MVLTLQAEPVQTLIHLISQISGHYFIFSHERPAEAENLAPDVSSLVPGIFCRQTLADDFIEEDGRGGTDVEATDLTEHGYGK